MSESTAADRLAKAGHTTASGGRCELCWRTAQTMYANGQGAYESLVSAYYAAMGAAEAAALTPTPVDCPPGSPTPTPSGLESISEEVSG